MHIYHIWSHDVKLTNDKYKNKNKKLDLFLIPKYFMQNIIKPRKKNKLLKENC